jgi:hypothetical protein
MHKFTEKLIELTPQVGAWSARNFPKGTVYDTFEGMMEELGELAHARLKGRQGIRGTPEEHHEAEVDACCDMAIYLIDMLYRSAVSLDGFAQELEESFAAREIAMSIVEGVDSVPLATIARGLLLTLAQMMGEFAGGVLARDRESREMAISTIPALLHHYGECIGVDLADELQRTWDKVGKRDWVTHPVDAHEQVA